jgi:hypothetical protein
MDEEQLSEMMAVESGHLPAWLLPGEKLEAANVTPVSLSKDPINPVRVPPIRYGPVEREVIREHVKQLLDAGVIEYAATDFSAPVVLAKKKDGSFRFCISFVQLNKQLRQQNWPLPLASDYFQSMDQASWFSSFDLTKSFFQLPLAADDGGMDAEGRKLYNSRDMCSFSTTDASYRFKRLPMGVAPASHVFERCIDSVIRGLKWQCCAVFIDDLLIFSPNWPQHLRDVDSLLARLTDASLKLSRPKRSWGRSLPSFWGTTFLHWGERPRDG